MVAPFNQAWMLLKNIRGSPTGRRMPMTEDESYGDVSFREHPLHGLKDDDEDMDGPSMPPMNRTMGGTPPPNVGRAGSSDEMPMGEPFNPFSKPLEGSMQDQLAEFADGAGREAGMPQQAFDDMEGNEGLHPNNPAAHNIGSSNARASPRQQRRGQMDSGRPYFKRPDRNQPYNFPPIENPSPTLNQRKV